MINEDFVSLEVAKKLMNKGFDEPCDKMLNDHEECYEYSCYTMSKKGFRNSDLCAYEVAIPTLYEVQKWLREGHLIHISVDFNHHGWYYRAYDIKENLCFDTMEGFVKTYEEALRNGIIEALNYF